jgi:hypothetical protein
MLGFLIFLLAMAVLAYCAIPPSMTDNWRGRVSDFKGPVGLERQANAFVEKFKGPMSSE